MAGDDIRAFDERHRVPLLFWSGRSFDEDGLAPQGSFEAAEARYTAADQIDGEALERWLGKSRDIQWDYENIVRRKGKLERRSEPGGGFAQSPRSASSAAAIVRST